MSRRLLEIVVKNGKELKNVHRSHGLKTYPVVFIGDKDGEIFYGSKKQKPVDLNGGSNPVWDAYDEFNVDTDEARHKKLYLFVRVESICQWSPGSKIVCEVSVAIEDLLNDFGNAVDKQSVTLKVKNEKGKEHGSVTFMYKFGRTHDPQPAASLPQPADPPLTLLEAPISRRLLEIVVKNGKELKNVHRSHGLKTYPVVFIGDKDGGILYGSKKQKPVDLNGGSNPVWDAYDEFNVDTDEARQKKLYLFVRVESICQWSPGSKIVCEVSVAIEDLLNDFGNAVDKQSVTLKVKNEKGKEHGSVTFMYKFGRTHDPHPAAPPLPQTGRSSC